jgi:hypothetical protein
MGTIALRSSKGAGRDRRHRIKDILNLGPSALLLDLV